MKHLLAAVLLLLSAQSPAPAGELALFVGDCSPARPHNCVTLGAQFGQAFTQFKVERGVLTLSFDGAWEPDAETRAALALAWQQGQPPED